MPRIFSALLLACLVLTPVQAGAFLYPQMFHRDNAAALVTKAQTALDEGRLEDAVEAYSRAINTGDLDPADMAAAYDARANIRLLQERPHQALADFRRSIEIAPSRAGGFLGRARAWLGLGNRAEAARDIESAAARCPDCPELDTLRRALKASPASPQ